MSPVSLAGQKAVIIGFAGYQELHLWYPVLRLRELGAEVTLAGAAGAEATSGALRYPLLPNAAVGDVVPDGRWAVIIPGGPGADDAASAPEVASFVSKAHAAGAWVAVIAEGAQVLAAAGLDASTERVAVAAHADAIPALFRQLTAQ
jgi:protease I